MTLGIVKRTEEEFQQWLMTEPGFVAALMAYDDEPVVLEAYQREFLTNRSRFRWVNKSRQVGFSFLFACEATARCHLREAHTSVMVSYNLEDAKEKVNYARQIAEGLAAAHEEFPAVLLHRGAGERPVALVGCRIGHFDFGDDVGSHASSRESREDTALTLR